MIVYKHMTFCMRKGCKVHSCPRNLAHVDWGSELPVSLSDFYKKRSACPEDEPTMVELEEESDDQS